MTGGCAGHGEAAEELRLLGLALLDRYEPRVRSVLAGLRVEAAEAVANGGATEDEPLACQWCPVCVVIAVLRGDRPELGGRLAEQAGTLLSRLRAVVEQPVERADAHAGDATADLGC